MFLLNKIWNAVVNINSSKGASNQPKPHVVFQKIDRFEEVGEVAEVLNKRDGRKASNSEDLKSQLANELVDVIHYAFAIASLNQINLNDVILEKDKKASIKYHHERNLEQFLLER